MVNAVDIFFDANDFFHDVNALDVLALSEERVTFFCRISHLLVSWVIFYRKSASIVCLFYLTNYYNQIQLYFSEGQPARHKLKRYILINEKII